jgi:hypothetical protein
MRGNQQLKVKAKVTLPLAVYRQSIYLGAKPKQENLLLSKYEYQCGLS